MLVSAAVCPHPPALVPAVSQGGSDLLDEARVACLRAVRGLIAAPHDVLVCVGAGPATTRRGREAGGSLRRFAVDVGFGGPVVSLSPALTIAAYLLGETGAAADVYQEVSADASPEECRALGTRLATLGGRVALLVMGDGSAKRTKQSPGYLDGRAEPFDAEVVQALAAPDPEALLTLDPALCDEIWVAGRPAWQVLAGALSGAEPSMTGTVYYDGAPLGVGYFVVGLSASPP